MRKYKRRKDRNMIAPIVAFIVGLFFGVEIGYVYAGGGMSETPQTWAAVAFILALLLVGSLGLRRI